MEWLGTVSILYRLQSKISRTGFTLLRVSPGFHSMAGEEHHRFEAPNPAVSLTTRESPRPWSAVLPGPRVHGDSACRTKYTPGLSSLPRRLAAECLDLAQPLPGAQTNAVGSPHLSLRYKL